MSADEQYREPNVVDPGDEPLDLQEVFVELLEASKQLPELDASQQDAWVSGLLASWRMDVVVADPAATDAEFDAWCRSQTDDAVADEICRVMDRLSGNDLCSVTGCWLVEPADGHGGSASAVLGFEHIDGSGHCVLAEIDNEGRLIDLHVGPSAEEMLPDEEALAEMEAPLRVFENDPAETAAAIADAWRRAADGLAPDQGFAEGLILNQLVVAARLRSRASGELPAFVVTDADPVVLHPDMSEGEVKEANQRTFETLQRALPDIGATTSPPDGTGADTDQLLQQAGLPLMALPAHLSTQEREALAFLEWADWLGVIIGLSRAGVGFAVTGTSMIDLINRCPEVTTSISKRDRPYVAFGLDVAAAWWSDLGLIEDGILTGLGHWTLPRAAALIWIAPQPGSAQ